MTSLDGRDLVVRALRAIGAIAVLYSFLYYALPAATGFDLVALLNLVLASNSAMLMNVLTFPVTQSGTHLILHGAEVVVTNDCNGLGVWFLVVGAMMAMPAVRWQSRVAGMAASGVALMSLNVVRISMLCYLQANRPLWFSTFHEQVAPLIIVIAASACVAAWFRRAAEADYAAVQ
jgi:exosortase/archaeosortase family protein